MAITVPITLTDGTTAYASDVMTNFQGIGNISQSNMDMTSAFDWTGRHTWVNTATTQTILSVTGSSLTSGKLAYFYTNTSDTTAANLVSSINDNILATGKVNLYLQQDAVGIIINAVSGANTALKLTNTGALYLGNDGSFSTGTGATEYLKVGSTAASNATTAITSIGYRDSDGPIGGIEWANAKLVSSEKRLGIITCRRIGADNTGFIEFYTMNSGSIVSNLQIRSDANPHLYLNQSLSGGQVTFTAANLSNTASSAACVAATVAGTSGGDPFSYYGITGGGEVSVGLDNSVTGDPYVISNSNTLGTNNMMVLNTSGELLLGDVDTPTANYLNINSGCKGQITVGNSITDAPYIVCEYNVSSITDGGTGICTVNWDTDFADTDGYTVSCGQDFYYSLSFGDQTLSAVYGKTASTTTVRSYIKTSLNTLGDGSFTLLAFGDQ